jgi:thiamine transport system ATP-binding protein
MSSVEVVGVGVRLGDRWLCPPQTFSVTDGEIVALLGPSGSGKTTLLRCIAGIVEPTIGHINIGGQTMTSVPTHKRKVAMVFQDHVLFPHLSVSGNIGIGLRAARVPKAERQARIDALLDLIGLRDRATDSVGVLSGGEAQRVALARALAPRPDVLLADEPLSALDPELRNRLAADLRAIVRAQGTTAIVVTHDRDEAARLADRIVTLSP